MTIRSMTGYSKVSAETDMGKITIEIQSVNQKYCSVYVSSPNMLNFLEDIIRKKISSAIHRGKIRVVINLDFTAKSNLTTLTPDYDYAQAYINALKEIQSRFGLKGDIDINVFQGNRDILSSENQELNEEYLEETILNLIDECLKTFIEQRAKEGKELIDDINKRIDYIISERNKIEQMAPQTLEGYRDKLLDRIKELNLDGTVDDDRIAREVALYADRIDISEELVRMRSHIKNFRDIVNKGGSIGKNLDFMLQEILREVNTMAAKCNNVEISQKTINIRSELERIREQVQNIE